ncbi:TolC family protein [Marinicella litoralis]|nr:TolC family protein [Marinicella litoralis]
MKNKIKSWLLTIAMCTPFSVVIGEELVTELSLYDAIKLAQANDPWLTGSEYKQNKLDAMSVAAGQLPDPVVSLGVANIASDTFSFNQEPMTQLKVGVTQMMSRGKTRSLKTAQMSLLANEQPFLRSTRLSMMASEVGQLWLDTYKVQESIRLIEQERPLFEQLVDLVEVGYGSGLGQRRQHDLIRAQLELTRLTDRLTQLNQVRALKSAQLNEFISADYDMLSPVHNPSFDVSTQLPVISLLDESLVFSQQEDSSKTLMSYLLLHPAIQAVDVQIAAEEKGVELAQQQYKPKWGINASYGYRGDAENHMSRADLFSVGVTFDLPLFTKNRQDQTVKAAVSSVAEKETQKTQLLRQMMSAFIAEKSQLLKLMERKKLYVESILPQMSQQTEAVINAYTNDQGDFAEVVRAKIAELNAQIDTLDITVNMVKTKLKLNYLLEGRKQTVSKAAINLELNHE